MKTILVFRSAGLGDFVMAAPAFAKLREVFPGRRVVLLTIQTSEKKTQKLVAAYAGGEESAPWTNLIWPHLVDDVVVLGSIEKLTDVQRIRKRLAGVSVEAGVLMLDPCAPWLGRLKKILLFILVSKGAPLYGWRGRGALSANRSRLMEQGLLRHHVHGPLQFLSELLPPRSYTNEDLKFDLRPDAEARAWARDWLVQNGLLGQRLVAIAPGAIQLHKQWPLDSFKVLLKRLLSRYPDLSVVVIGAPKDRELALELCGEATGRVFNVAGTSMVAQSAALMAHVCLVIGNDGGAMHLADAMGCKVISIVPGIEYPDSIEPWHNKDLIVRWPVPCAPCYSFTECPQGHRRCMVDLPVDLVWAQCQKVL